MATKKDLIKKLEKKLAYLSEQDIKDAINCIMDYIKEELSKGNRVEIRGFGSFSIRKRKYANKAEEYNTVYYRMSKNILEKLNGQDSA